MKSRYVFTFVLIVLAVMLSAASCQPTADPGEDDTGQDEQPVDTTEEQDEDVTEEPTTEPTATLMPTEAPTSTPEPTETPLPTDTPEPTPSPEPIGTVDNPVTANEDWTPVLKTFEREMALVPAGCDVDGNCFEPYYIDVYEVTVQNVATFLQLSGNQYDGASGRTWYGWRDAYAGIGGDAAKCQYNNGMQVCFAGDNSCTGTLDYCVEVFISQSTLAPNPAYVNLPGRFMSWYGAQAYCEARGGRLPTEEEFKYAARGPSGWDFPWGNEDDATKRGYQGAPYDPVCPQPLYCPVGSFPDGASWVGAQDLEGNMFEFMYTEDPSTVAALDVVNSERADFEPRGIAPYNYMNHVGFRCVKPAENP